MCINLWKVNDVCNALVFTEPECLVNYPPMEDIHGEVSQELTIFASDHLPCDRELVGLEYVAVATGDFHLGIWRPIVGGFLRLVEKVELTAEQIGLNVI